MKSILLSLLIVIFGISVTGQQLTKQDYLHRSKTQKTGAVIFTVAGGVIAVTGLIVHSSKSTSSYYPGLNEGLGNGLIIAGAAFITGGVILFLASNRNKKKANAVNAAFHFEFQHAEIYQKNSLVKNYYPAVSLHVSLK